jgi:hypothetical protein
MQLGDLTNDRWLKGSAVFAGLFLLSGAYLNYRFRYPGDLGPAFIVLAWYCRYGLDGMPNTLASD